MQANLASSYLRQQIWLAAICANKSASSSATLRDLCGRSMIAPTLFSIVHTIKTLPNTGRVFCVFMESILVLILKPYIIPKAEEYPSQESNHSILLYDCVSTNSPLSLLAMPAHSNTAASTKTGSYTESPSFFPA